MHSRRKCACSPLDHSRPAGSSCGTTESRWMSKGCNSCGGSPGARSPTATGWRNERVEHERSSESSASASSHRTRSVRSSAMSAGTRESTTSLYLATTKFSYPLPLLRDVFTTLETPAQKLIRIRGLTEPAEGFDYSDLLVRIWQRQGKEARGDVVPYRSIFQDGPWKEEGMGFEDFQRRLVALDTLAAGRISMNMNREHVYLRQSPDLILDQMEKSLWGEGHDIPETSAE